MFEYKIDKSQEIIFVTISEKITIVDVMAHIDRILKDPDFFQRYNSLVTIDDSIIVPNIAPDKIALIQNVINGYAQRRKGAKWAVFVFNKTARAIVETALDLIGPLSANIRIFQSWADAFTWIREQQ
jgi:hypothetical protein